MVIALCSAAARVAAATADEEEGGEEDIETDPLTPSTSADVAAKSDKASFIHFQYDDHAKFQVAYYIPLRNK